MSEQKYPVWVYTKLDNNAAPNMARVICGVIHEVYKHGGWSDEVNDKLCRVMLLATNLASDLYAYRKMNKDGLKTKTGWRLKQFDTNDEQPVFPNRRYAPHHLFDAEVRDRTLGVMGVAMNGKYGELPVLFSEIMQATSDTKVKDLCIEAAWMAGKMINKVLDYEAKNEAV